MLRLMACLMAGSALVVAAPAWAARNPASDNPALTYVHARAAAMSGEHQRSAELLAVLADANTGDLQISRRAMSEALAAGNIELALRLGRRLPLAEMPVDGRLLLAADELRRNRPEVALRYVSEGAKEESSLEFIEPLIKAWAAAERRDLNAASTIIDQIPVAGLLGPYRFENKAFVLLKFRKTAEAEPFARRAIAMAGSRDVRLRLALADGFLAAGDRQRAMAMVEGLGDEAGSARQRIAAGKRNGMAVDHPAEAYGELLLAMSADLSRMNNRSLPIGMVQVARFANPRNSSSAVLLAALLSRQGRAAEALRILDQLPADDPQAAAARDAKVRILVDEERLDEALRIAAASVSTGNATIGDYSRLAEVLAESKRFNEAADAYGRAIGMANAQGLKDELWPLHLLRATALEDANRWPEAKQALHSALALAPEQPLILNFLGYAMLERGEQLDVAEAMIRKASALAPDEASITDSLGWALFKRGRLPEAIETLQRAAASDPQQFEIHEHLGDALYASGRRYEARFAWQAALLSAEEDVAPRIRLKIDTGLTPATAAP
jgi:tetratricopeptide (TPR) repeat protein